MPVGQDVIASSVGASDAAGAAASAGAACAGLAGAPASGSTTPMINVDTSSGVSAARREATKSLRTKALESLAKSFMCWEPDSSGAAIPITRSAGPSFAPKSTGFAKRMKPKEATFTASVRQ